ncbi:unnamed protein product [Closterium sp. NIES-65]|nr:unnamed protein product [Closterium sp. NIES-65]
MGQGASHSGGGAGEMAVAPLNHNDEGGGCQRLRVPDLGISRSGLVECHFTLWSQELIFRPRKDGRLGVCDPFMELSGLAARRVGKLVLARSGVRSWLATKAADLLAGFRSFWAHPEFLKAWKGRSVRWKQTCEMFMRSSISKKGPISHWDIAQEPLVFNRQVLPNVKKSLGRKEAAKGLELLKLGDFVGQTEDGAFFFKDEKLLTKELGTRKKVMRALKVFGSVPDSWKEKLVAPIAGEELLAESAFVKKVGMVGAWKAERVVQEGLACRACDCFGVPLVGAVVSTVAFALDKVEPLMVRGGRVIGAGGLPEVRLRCSELCMDDRIPPFRQLILLFGKQQGVMQQQEKWSEEWGKVIDWKRVMRVRDCAVLPNRARDVLLRVHCRNLHVGVRLNLLEEVACPYCGEEETVESCLFGCPRIQPVVQGLLKALGMINPGRKITSLGDLLFHKEGSTSGFLESTVTAIALHKI